MRFLWFSLSLKRLGAFAKLRKATISFVMFVRLSACLSILPHWTTQCALDGFSWNMTFEDFFFLICRNNSSLGKSDEENGYFTWDLFHFFLEVRNISDKNVEEIKTHFSKVFLLKSCRLWDNVEKYGRAGQATDGNIIRRMRFAGWVTTAIDTLRMCNPYCLPPQQCLHERASVPGCW